MIKDVMVRLEADAADDLRLAAADTIAAPFDGRIIGLFFNVLPLLALPIDPERPRFPIVGLLRRAREAGSIKESVLIRRMRRLRSRFEIRRFDVFPEDVTAIAVREARTSDTFLALRPRADVQDPEHFVESILLGAGRHLYILPDGHNPVGLPSHVLIAWNGSREATRAVAEAMPFLHRAQKVTVVVVHSSSPVEREAVLGSELTNHLAQQGMKAELRHVTSKHSETGSTLIAEAQRRNAEAIVMGGYGQSRTKEWLLGGVTYELLRKTPIPVIMAH
jgi:nucleotide-binding universal stress UspA family protein